MSESGETKFPWDRAALRSEVKAYRSMSHHFLVVLILTAFGGLGILTLNNTA